MRLPTVLGLGALLLGGCVGDIGDGELIANDSIRIVGGSSAFPGEYPGVLGLYDGVHLCTATLVEPEWAITAAHCVTPELTGHATLAEVTSSFYLLLDDVDLTDQNITSRQIRLKEVFVHPDWNFSKLGDNDVAVLHLVEKVTDRDPVPLYRTPVPNATPVTQVGYGVSNALAGTGAGVLRTLNTVTADCDNYGRSDLNLLCFDANDGNGTCFGDSGGPTFVTVAGELEIAGITSFGSSDQCTGYDASTHIAGELAFIDAHVPKIAGGTPQTGDPTADPEIGPAPTILSGCSVGHGRGRPTPGFALFATLCAVLVARRLARRT